MPFFTTTKTIFKTPWEDEVYESKWFETDKLVLPPGGPDDAKNKWDYARELQITDVDIWEMLYFESGGMALYAAWKPYAEFYLITGQQFYMHPERWETHYGPGAAEKAYKRAVAHGMPIEKKQIWIENDDLWLYNDSEKKIIIT